ncbi:MAG: sigma-54 dependent transcriptional regulator [Chromatiales bacterium]|nr:sigma-54 dependent transcriptional regulator [Chromatiales bacterium]
MSERTTLLVVEDEPLALRNLKHVMEKEGYRVLAAASGEKALQWLEREPVAVVLTDVRMEGMDGLAVLMHAKRLRPDCEVILITGYAALDAAVGAMRQGAFYYVSKPFRLDEVRRLVREAVDKVRLKDENRRLRERLGEEQGGFAVVTRDAGMQRLLDTARQIAPTDCNVLITGESGTGKELFARYLHAHSRRSSGPFLAVNCGAFTEELLANELFGHEKGAFTGATDARAGLVEAAAGGTLFLDEVTEMPPSMQVKLLRVLQEKEVLRLGSTRPLPVDVRFLAASNRDVQQAVRDGRFRQDLYFRLNVVTLHVPPLAARRADIALLAGHFLEKYAAVMGKPVRELAPDALMLLEDYGFPGNVRELENIIARGVALAGGERIEAGDLPEDLRLHAARTFRTEQGRIPSLADQEEAYLRWVLEQTDGNRSQAARLLGIDRVSLWRKLKKFGIE